MEVSFEIKTGDLECPYTGEATDVLVKASGEEHSTGWLSVPVLEKCLKFLRAFTELEKDGDECSDIRKEILGEIQLIRQYLQTQSRQEPVHRPSVERQAQPAEAAVSSAPRAKSPAKAGPSQRDKMAAKQFAEEIADLVNNPPVDDNPLAKSSGLSEAHIRECIHKWKSVFEDPKNMYPILFGAFQMTRERFETILKVKS